MISHALALEADLRRRIRGEVRFDDGTRALYATDSSNYRQVPIGVVVPRTADAVVAAIALCRSHGVPVLLRGGGTSLAGQTCNHAVVIDVSRHLVRCEIDRDAGIAQVYERLLALRDRYADLIRTRFPDMPRRVSGYNLPDLLPEHGFHVGRALVGSEATCVAILGATLRLVRAKPPRTLAVLGYPDI